MVSSSSSAKKNSTTNKTNLGNTVKVSLPIIYETDVEITPEEAKQILEAKSTNRKIQQSKVLQLARDMENGKWRNNVEPIGFDLNGRLCDGQHRLSAQVKVQQTVKYAVRRNLRPEDISVMDTGNSRTAAHAAQVLGYANVNNKHTGCVQSLALPKDNSLRLTHSELIYLYQIYKAGVDLAVRNVPMNTSSAITSAIAKAFYHLDTARLVEFCEVFSSGYTACGEKDYAAVTLRNYVLRLRQDKLATSSTEIRKEIYLKTQLAIKAFVEFKPLKKFQTSGANYHDDLFPLDLDIYS